MSNDNNPPDDNVRSLFKNIPVAPPEEPKLPQSQYTIIAGKQTYNKTGHVVITSQNIVLLDEKQELSFCIPNNDALVSIERVSPSEEK